jgi:adenine-specific DNA-methyltransferase
MKKEEEYANIKGNEYLKKFGQFFTDEIIVQFMVNWTCKEASNVLDPAVGNNIFLRYCKKNFPLIKEYGYEIDKNILDFFENTNDFNIINEDYLLSDWLKKYDAIVCNPPYNKFQAIENRDIIIKNIFDNTGISLSSYTNLYIYFLLKSIFQLSNKGKMSYIIPTEFLNSKYGNKIKEILLKNNLLYAIINFKNNKKIFNNATTTSCIILINKTLKDSVKFFNIESADDLNNLDIESDIESLSVKYSELINKDKWRSYININETKLKFKNLKPTSEFCHISRGIATGANDYFCFSKDKIENYKIPNECLSKCICRSEDVKGNFFSNNDFENLLNDNKKVYLLNATTNNIDKISTYINYGEKIGIKEKYIPAHRKYWYSIEQKNTAPIWVSSAYRKTIKFIRNIANISNLTTFHSVFVKREFIDKTNLIFCYFLTPTAQEILKESRKEMGNGLNKFQPNDLNNSKMLDISVIEESDRNKIETIYSKLQDKITSNLISELDKIFLKYLTI